MWSKSVLDIGHQTTKGSDPLEMGNRLSPTSAPAVCPDRVSRPQCMKRSIQAHPSEALSWRDIAKNLRRPSSSRSHALECSRGESWPETGFQRSPEALLKQSLEHWPAHGMRKLPSHHDWGRTIWKTRRNKTWISQSQQCLFPSAKLGNLLIQGAAGTVHRGFCFSHGKQLD